LCQESEEFALIKKEVEKLENELKNSKKIEQSLIDKNNQLEDKIYEIGQKKDL